MPHYCEICDDDTDNAPGLILVDMGEGTAICQDCLAAHATVCYDEEETTMAGTTPRHPEGDQTMATTTDGWTIGTHEPQGPCRGQNIGKLWLKDPNDGWQWVWYDIGTPGDARRAASAARQMTKDQVEHWAMQPVR